MKGAVKSVFASFPQESLKMTIEHVMADGDFVLTRSTVHAVHKGPFNGIPATNKEVTWTELNLFRIKDGQIEELWSEGNFLGLMAQLGAFAPPPGAAH
jgi:predicted ester cyclase